MGVRDDRADYSFFASADAAVDVRLGGTHAGRVLFISGNRAGLLALANVLLYLFANSWRRELLSLREVPFVRMEGTAHVVVRVMQADPSGDDGLLLELDAGDQLEWQI